MTSSPTHLSDNDIIEWCIPGIIEFLRGHGWSEGEIFVDKRKSFVCAPINGRTLFIAFVFYQESYHYIVASYQEKDEHLEVGDDLRLLTPEEIESLRNRGVII